MDLKETLDWLDDEERSELGQLTGEGYDGVLARRLAETRRMFALLCSREGLCPQEERERFDVTYFGAQGFEDFFLTMPRPK